MKINKTSKISGFYKKSIDERIDLISSIASLTEEEQSLLFKAMDKDLADHMIENVVGTFTLPLGIALNFRVNNEDVFIPMATEESSVVAAASKAAKIARKRGGFRTESTDPIMIGQIQILDVDDVATASEKILQEKNKLLTVANAQDKILIDLGGGAKDLAVRILTSSFGKMIVVHLYIDVRDAMGANAVNTMVEALAPVIEDISGGRVRLKILSNLADQRLVKSRAIFDKDLIGGEKVVDAFLESVELAKIDPYRAATHNKGIMNGIDAVIIATGNDFRAIEAGAHAYAARNGQYTSLTNYWKDETGNLVGEIKLPLALGIVGGAGSIHPTAQMCKKMMRISSAQQLSELVASVGLAQNFAAVLALSTVGIQKGHMSLHAKNIAMMAGANEEDIDRIANILIKEGNVKLDRAKELLNFHH
ncbi:MAG TPA: hydroxymethylglutaryl-CoA reductase, degradative [Candidatus Thermoplasmatota archaeon]|nr:hydroxymethylglutaryl-CoA reductase, degradative [Candidatus Thermoplasmatota archaeon]